MSYGLTITIPGKLERDLSPNGRAHRWRKDQLRRQAIHDTHYTLRAAIDLNDPVACFQTAAWPLTLNWTIGLTNRQRPYDDDNAIAALKAHRDAIANALGMDDRNFRTGRVQQMRDPENRGFVAVEIVSADDVPSELREAS